MKLVNLDTLKTFYNKIKPKIGGGYIYAENYGKDFWTALDEAIYKVEEGGIIDCTSFTGNHTITQNFVINKPCKIIFGNIDVTYNGDASLFDIQSDNVIIEGINRNADKTSINTGASIFRLNGTNPSLMSNNEGYHVYSSGYKNLIFRGLTLVGKQTTLGRQYQNSTYPLDGYGGIYIEKQNPGTTSSGNNVNSIKIENVLIDGTKAHGIYLDTPILSTIKDVRISSCAGHGVFINGGTTCTLESVYISSCQLAGFCIYSHTYSTILNCVAENCGCGFWIRSSFNISVFNAGVENTITYGANPWRLSQPISGKYGFNLYTGNDYYIPDVTSDSYGYFIGHGIIISGGKAINFFSPYITNIGNTKVYEVYTGGTTVSKNIRYLLVTGTNGQSMVTNIRQKDTIGTNSTNTNDIQIDKDVDSFELVTDPKQGTITTEPYIADFTSIKACIANLSGNSIIRNGDTVFTQVNFKQKLYPLVLKQYSASWNNTWSKHDVFYELLIPKEAVYQKPNVIIALFKVSDKKWKCKDYNKVTFQNKKWTPLKINRSSLSNNQGVWNYGKDYDLQKIIAEDEFLNYSIPDSMDNVYTKINGEEYHRIGFTNLQDIIYEYYIDNNPNTGNPKIFLSYSASKVIVRNDIFSGAPGDIFNNGYKFRLYNNWRGPSSYKYASIKAPSELKVNNGIYYKLYPLTKATNIIFGVAAIDVGNAKFLTEIIPIRAEIRPIIRVEYEDEDCTYISSNEIYWDIRYYQYDKKIQEGVLTTSLTRRSS